MEIFTKDGKGIEALKGTQTEQNLNTHSRASAAHISNICGTKKRLATKGLSRFPRFSRKPQRTRLSTRKFGLDISQARATPRAISRTA